MFQIKAVQKIETHILYSVTFFLRMSCRLYENAEKYGGVKEAADGNVACWTSKAKRAQHTPTSVHSQPPTHARTEKYAYSFSTATVVSWTRLNITLHWHCLSCVYILVICNENKRTCWNTKTTQTPTSLSRSLKFFLQFFIILAQYIVTDVNECHRKSTSFSLSTCWPVFWETSSNFCGWWM
jgi:hypothetical protein